MSSDGEKKSLPYKIVNKNAVAVPLKRTLHFEMVCPHETKEYAENVLTTAYGVIKLILSQLNWADLITASKVCREWEKVANVLFKERFGPFWFYIVDHKSESRFIFNYSPFVPQSKPALCLMFMNETATKALKCKSLPEESCLPGCEDNHRLLQCVELEYAKSGCPLIAVYSNSAKCSFKDYPPFFNGYDHGDPKVQLCIASMPGLIGISLPEIPNVKMKNFHLKRSSDFKDLVSVHIGENHRLKCLMAFVGIRRRWVVEQTIVLEGFIRAVCEHQPSHPFAFGGGIIRGIKESHYDKAFPINDGKIVCITFSVPNDCSTDFNASSVILWENATEEEDIDNIFGNLSKKTVRRQHMAAFRYACVSRYVLSDLETECFQKYFPNVPMIGFEGLGEIGLFNVEDSTTNGVQDDSQDQKRQCTDLEFAHSNTSVIVLLSWGKIISTNSS